MANISLNKSVRTCKVNTGWAERMYSDRFQNSDIIVCPVWNQVDNAGRAVCRDSFYTKYQGCNSANDRITVENDLRPQYMEYVTLDASGIEGDMSGRSCNVGVGDARNHTVEGYGRMPRQSAIRENYVYSDAVQGCQTLQNAHKYTGQFGQNNFRSWIEPTCSANSYEEASAQCAADRRNLQAATLGAKNYRNMYSSHQ